LTNPVTGLPEGTLVDERLRDCLVNQDWAILLVRIKNLDAFRDVYGFVASDDVLRAVSLMIRNILREVSNVTDMIGQWSPSEFIVFTSPGKQAALSEQIRLRLEQCLEFFYPLKDRDVKQPSSAHLKIDLRQYSQVDGPVSSLDELKSKL
jgi:GGDEF domain-containing protein